MGWYDWIDTGLLIGGPCDGERRYDVDRRFEHLEVLEEVVPISIEYASPSKVDELIANCEIKKSVYVRQFFAGNKRKWSFWMYSGTNIDNAIERLLAAYGK